MCLKYIGSTPTITMSCRLSEYDVLLNDGTVYNVATYHFYSKCVGQFNAGDIKGLNTCGKEQYDAAQQTHQYSYRILLSSANWTIEWLQEHYLSLVGNGHVCMPAPLHVPVLYFAYSLPNNHSIPTPVPKLKNRRRLIEERI